MHSVDQINIGTTGLAPHTLNPRCPAAAEGVACGVGRPQIGFDFGQAHCHSSLGSFSDDDLPEKAHGNLGSRTLVECPAKRQVGMAQVA